MANSITFQKKITCRKCAYEIPLYNPDEVEIIACPKCFKIQSEKYPNYNSITNLWIDKFSIIPLGTECFYENQDYIVVGIVLKQVTGQKWLEYSLMNSEKQYLTLSQWEGHYHVFKQVDISDPKILKELTLNSVKFEFNNKKFVKLSRYKPSTHSLIGEFNYDIVDIRKSTCIDFINPPEIITYEVNQTQTDLFHGKYLSKDEISKFVKNFSVTSNDLSTVGMAKPFLRGFDLQLFNKIMCIFIAVLTFVHFLFHAGTKDYKVLSTTKQALVEENVSNSFVLKEKSGAYYLNFYGMSDLSNEWIEDQITLVNETTGEEREFSLGLEYYSGISDGYSWSEGSDAGEINISGVAPGRYHLKEKFVSSSTAELPFTMMVSVSSPSSWNYTIIFFTSIAIILVLNFLNAKFEEKRTGKMPGIFSNFFKSTYK